jgi:hypothetical protein
MDYKALNDKEKAQLEVISKKPYHEQAQYVLNAFWGELQDKAEAIYGAWGKFKDLDKQQHNALVSAGKASGDYVEGSSLDEFWSHKLLENIGKTMSIVQFRQEFKKIDANTDKRMGIVEFILYEYGLSVNELLARPQGGDPAELAQAQKLMDEVSAAFTAAQTALDQASKTEATAKKTKETADKSAIEAKKTADESAVAAEAAAKTASEAKKKADEAAAAAAEQQAAVDALKAEETAYNNKTEDLKAKSEAGGVSGMRSKNELAQHLSEDPLPLRKAKITAEAAAKKTDKANAVAQAAREIAEKDAKAAKEAAEKAKAAKEAADADKIAADQAAEEAERDRIASEERVKECEAKLAEAEAYLNEVKKKSDKTYGTFWWLDRELAERKKYMPKSGKAKLLF